MSTHIYKLIDSCMYVCIYVYTHILMSIYHTHIYYRYMQYILPKMVLVLSGYAFLSLTLGFWGQTTWVQISALPLPVAVTSLRLPVPPRTHL